VNYDNPLHLRSQSLAMKDVALRMSGSRAAAPTMYFEGARQLIYSSLERIGTLLPPAKQQLFYAVAVDLLPRGSFNAYACFPNQEASYVLLDTGVIDFFGNLAAVFTMLAETADGTQLPPFSEQQIIDFIWASGLIYYGSIDDPERKDCGIRDIERLGAVHAPKLHFGQLPLHLRVPALNLSMGAVIFLVCHEIAHVLNQGHPTLSESIGSGFCLNLENMADEWLADEMAFQLMIDYAIRFPDRAKVKCLLSSVDFALTCLNLMQSAFPCYWGERMDGEQFVVVRESLGHPMAAARRAAYRKLFAARIPPAFFTLDDRFETIESRYATMIRKGARPSTEFEETTETSRLIDEMSHGRSRDDGRKNEGS